MPARIAILPTRRSLRTEFRVRFRKAATVPDPERPTKRRYMVLFVLCSLGFIVYVDRLCLAKTKDQIVAACRWEELDEAEQRTAVAAAEKNAREKNKPAPPLAEIFGNGRWC